MKRQNIVTFAILLALAGAISYGIIWYRKKKSGTSVPDSQATDQTNGTGSGTSSSTGTNVNTGSSTGTGYLLPPINSYAWWLSLLGHASFPLKKGSKGIEVYKMQETMNDMVRTRKLNAGVITEDGLFGVNTEGRLALLFPGTTQVTEYMFRQEFDPMMEILK